MLTLLKFSAISPIQILSLLSFFKNKPQTDKTKSLSGLNSIYWDRLLLDEEKLWFEYNISPWKSSLLDFFWGPYFRIEVQWLTKITQWLKWLLVERFLKALWKTFWSFLLITATLTASQQTLTPGWIIQDLALLICWAMHRSN